MSSLLRNSTLETVFRPFPTSPQKSNSDKNERKSGESSTPDPDTLETYRDTPPISIAILLQKYVLLLAESIYSTNLYHDTPPICIAILLQKYWGQGSLGPPQEKRQQRKKRRNALKSKEKVQNRKNGKIPSNPIYTKPNKNLARQGGGILINIGDKIITYRFLFWVIISVIITVNLTAKTKPGRINSCNVRIGTVLPWKERIFRLQLQFFSRRCVGMKYCTIRHENITYPKK